MAAAWVLRQRPRHRVNVALAVAFAANGIAYAIFNTALPGTRTTGSLALEGRGLFNWIAAPAMLAFTGLLIRDSAGRRVAPWIAAVAIGGPGVFAAVQRAQAAGIDLLAFGGTIVYPTAAFALGAMAVLFAASTSASVRAYCAFVSAALVINSVDHIGAGIVPPRTISPIELIAMTILLALWTWNAFAIASERGLAMRVIACMVLPFAAGVAVRLAVGTYLAVQQSGFIGIGRFIASAILIYAARRSKLTL